MDINIAMCRTMVGDLRKDLAPLGIRVNKDAAVLDAGFGQWFFETDLPHPTHHTETFKIYVEGDNAYDARAKGWYKYLELLDYGMAGDAREDSEMEVKIVKVDPPWQRFKTARWIIVHPENGGQVSPAAFKTEAAARRYMAESFPTITVVN